MFTAGRREASYGLLLLRELIEHVIVLNEQHLQPLLRHYVHLLQREGGSLGSHAGVNLVMWIGFEYRKRGNAAYTTYTPRSDLIVARRDVLCGRASPLTQPRITTSAPARRGSIDPVSDGGPSGQNAGDLVLNDDAQDKQNYS
jgi:hypothetical protein